VVMLLVGRFDRGIGFLIEFRTKIILCWRR